MAATDWMAALPQGVEPWVPAPFVALGTDGFGRSDTREALRAYFEIDAAEHRRGRDERARPDGAITAAAASAAIAELGWTRRRPSPGQ